MALASALARSEPPTPLQGAGVAVAAAGAVLYFWPGSLAVPRAAGVGIALVALAANAGGALLGRKVNRECRPCRPFP